MTETPPTLGCECDPEDIRAANVLALPKPTK